MIYSKKQRANQLKRREKERRREEQPPEPELNSLFNRHPDFVWPREDKPADPDLTALFNKYYTPDPESESIAPFQEGLPAVNPPPGGPLFPGMAKAARRGGAEGEWGVAQHAAHRIMRKLYGKSGDVDLVSDPWEDLDWARQKKELIDQTTGEMVRDEDGTVRVIKDEFQYLSLSTMLGDTTTEEPGFEFSTGSRAAPTQTNTRWMIPREFYRRALKDNKKQEEELIDQTTGEMVRDEDGTARVIKPMTYPEGGCIVQAGRDAGSGLYVGYPPG